MGRCQTVRVEPLAGGGPGTHQYTEATFSKIFPSMGCINCVQSARDHCSVSCPGSDPLGSMTEHIQVQRNQTGLGAGGDLEVVEHEIKSKSAV